MVTLSHKIHSAIDIIPAMTQKITTLERMISPVGEPVNIHRIEIPCERIDILEWLEAQTAQTKIYWANREGEQETGGIGIADEIKGTSEIGYDEIFEHVERRFDFLNPSVRYFGGHCFDSKNIDKTWVDFGSFYFFVPRFEITQDKHNATFACNIIYSEITEETLAKIIVDLHKLNFIFTPAKMIFKKPLTRMDSPKEKAWIGIFQNTLTALKEKTIQKIVLARKSIFDFEFPIQPFLLKKKLKNLTPECFHFCFQPKSGVAFLGASPERLYKRSGTKIKTEAIAGTKAKGKSDADNNRLRGELLASTKDLAEHRLVKDSITSSLKPLTSTLNIDPKPSILELNWGHHLKTSFDGVLNNNVGDAELLKALHPTPAVAGWPIEESIELINKLEPFARGWYSGPFGYIGQETSEFTVAIRSGLIDNRPHPASAVKEKKENKAKKLPLGRISLFAGAGILPQSNRKAEWMEIENKMLSFFKVFEPDVQNTNKTVQ